MEIKEITTNEKSKICEDILRTLPEWFGVEESTKAYINGVKDLLFYASYIDEKPVGFISFKEHYPRAYEVYVMGVYKEHQAKQIGSKLLAFGEEELRKVGAKFLQVKTLSESSDDKFYAKTRAFYIKNGFTPIEEFKTLWDEWNPCLLLLKAL